MGGRRPIQEQDLSRLSKVIGLLLVGSNMGQRGRRDPKFGRRVQVPAANNKKRTGCQKAEALRRGEGEGGDGEERRRWIAFSMRISFFMCAPLADASRKSTRTGARCNWMGTTESECKCQIHGEGKGMKNAIKVGVSMCDLSRYFSRRGGHDGRRWAAMSGDEQWQRPAHHNKYCIWATEGLRAYELAQAHAFSVAVQWQGEVVRGRVAGARRGKSEVTGLGVAPQERHSARCSVALPGLLVLVEYEQIRPTTPTTGEPVPDQEQSHSRITK